ncbi:hypothetical protein BCR41DRAFT_386859 [Lobosporangium transversale]|uniref:LYC1 C-terminal domain-containing protein n=1 Tax=Lobosporangium transversale TaxID=64571 RepID=A0A1Y2GKZ0_9FUNG|nr:hypothetical protein BCR41DRAFT_386859 [Lobosporangium transversale]ORZ14282.1 hypothetical protein BCR41DRAFT_386859 [Lobosporangium transversale]|eukprot:XP_021880760.1 hypothetical protein BCR41DRAFT_386859 [Lobosporangium transversale]
MISSRANTATVPELELVLASDPDVIKQVWINNKVHFAPYASDEAWLEKSRIRTNVDLGPGMGHSIWVLVPRGKGNDPTSILSAAHIILRPGLISKITSKATSELPTNKELNAQELKHSNTQHILASQQNGHLTESTHELKEIAVAYVLLVFTPIEHRSRGFANAMLRMVMDKLKHQTDPVVDLSYLFSAIEPTFYANLGWQMMRSRELVLDQLKSHVFPDLPLVDASAAGAKYRINNVTESDLREIVNEDVELLRSEMAKCTLEAPRGQNLHFVTILPHEEAFRTHFEMTRYSNLHIDHINRPITRIGVRLVSIDEHYKGLDAFVIWTYIPSSSRICILRLRYQTVHQLQCLLREAMKEAQEWGFSMVSVWDLNDKDALAATGMFNRDRTSWWLCVAQMEHENFGGSITMVANGAYTWGL